MLLDQAFDLEESWQKVPFVLQRVRYARGNHVACGTLAVSMGSVNFLFA